jgi:WD40 repeat protein
MRRLPVSLLLALAAFGAACGSDSNSATDPRSQLNPCPAAGSQNKAMTVLGCGDFKPKRITGEINVRGTTGYTTTWNNGSSTSALYVWDVAGNVPKLVDSVLVDGASTLGDVVVTPDGKHLVVATEYAGGSIVIYSLTDPRKPQHVTRFTNAETAPGVHTAEVGLVNGKLYAFLCVDPGAAPAKLVIVDITNAAAPQQVYSRFIGAPFVHDTYLRDGILFLGLWNAGVAIWDLGGAGLGGTPSNPVDVGSVQTANGHVHNIWWLKDPVTGSSRYAFIGEESPGSVGTSSSGDIHVVDVSNMSAPREVAFYTVPGAGTHNFSVDEQNGILYAAYYNGGVRAIDVRGELGTCTDAQKSSPVNQVVQLCDLSKMGRELAVGLKDRSNAVFVWGVQYLNGSVYASDMLNGIWKLSAVSR